MDSRHVGAVPHQVCRSTPGVVAVAAEACKILLLLPVRFRGFTLSLHG